MEQYEKLMVDEKYTLDDATRGIALKKIEAHYKVKPTEVLESFDDDGKYIIGMTKGGGIVVARFNKVVDSDGGDRFIKDSTVTLRKTGDSRIDDPHQQVVAPAGIMHTYYGICDGDGDIEFWTRNSTKKGRSHVDHLLNTNKWGGLNTVEIAAKYRQAVSRAIDVLKKLPQS